MITKVGAVNSFTGGENAAKQVDKKAIAAGVAVGVAALTTAAYIAGGKVDAGKILGKEGRKADGVKFFTKALDIAKEGLNKFHDFAQDKVVSKITGLFKKKDDVAEVADDAAKAAAKTADDAAEATT